jgi:molybdate transport system substrate-binding protein
LIGPRRSIGLREHNPVRENGAMVRAIGFGVALAAVLAGAGAARADEVVVFAAASLKTALDDFAGKWQAETGNTVTISYAGSNALAKQIIEGAPADVFISAAVNWMDEVEKAGLVAEGEREDLLGNTLVLIAHGKDAAKVDIAPGFDLKGMLGDEKLAMALVDSVPAGQYGKAALETLGVWAAVEPSVAQADNVRAALALVAAGEAPLGIVYATDAAADDDVAVVGTFPADSYPPIVYPAALLTGAADTADRAFYEALSSTEAEDAFRAQGFAILD